MSKCDDPHHLSKVDVAVVFVIFAILGSLVWVFTTSTDENARMDALGAMCRTYAGMDGGPAQVLGDEQHGFYVECKNSTRYVQEDIMNKLVMNITVVQ